MILSKLRLIEIFVTPMYLHTSFFLRIRFSGLGWGLKPYKIAIPPLHGLQWRHGAVSVGARAMELPHRSAEKATNFSQGRGGGYRGGEGNISHAFKTPEGSADIIMVTVVSIIFLIFDFSEDGANQRSSI